LNQSIVATGFLVVVRVLYLGKGKELICHLLNLSWRC
jgi:hypothetical protein